MPQLPAQGTFWRNLLRGVRTSIAGRGQSDLSDKFDNHDYLIIIILCRHYPVHLRTVVSMFTQVASRWPKNKLCKEANLRTLQTCVHMTLCTSRMPLFPVGWTDTCYQQSWGFYERNLKQPTRCNIGSRSRLSNNQLVATIVEPFSLVFQSRLDLIFVFVLL